MAPAPGAHHQGLDSTLHVLLATWAVPRGLGKVYGAPFDVKLSEHDIVEPDILFIRGERLGIVKSRFGDGAPDLIVEILVPPTRHVDLEHKADVYAAAGVPEYWITDPMTRSLTILTLRDGRYEPVPMENGILRSVVLPGLVVDVTALFADLVQ